MDIYNALKPVLLFGVVVIAVTTGFSLIPVTLILLSSNVTRSTAPFNPTGSDINIDIYLVEDDTYFVQIVW